MNVLVITLGVVACAALLSHAHITITTKHIYPQNPQPPVDNLVPLTEEQLDKLHEEAGPTFDDVLKAVHSILGDDGGESNVD